MDPDRNSLAQVYGEKSDAELLKLHATGALTDAAYDVIERELVKRKITIPTRPDVETKNIDADDKKLNGLGGWLILVGISIVLNPLFFLINLLQYDQRTWDPIHMGIVIYLGLAFVVSSILVYLFFSKHRWFPKIYIGYLLVFLVAVPLTVWLLIALVSGESIFNLEATKIFGSGIITVAIWVPYMLQSRRVKATFTN